MMNFKSYYRTLFKTFGFPLKPSHALPAAAIAKAEKRLGVRIPAALRDYYLVAGKERRFNTCHNRLLPPSEWFLDKKRLVFMVENQAVVLWSVSTANPKAQDPSAFVAVNEEPYEWQQEHRKLSVFLAVMLHYQAVGGGLPFRASGDAPKRCRLEDDGYTCCGEINSQLAYNRAERVIFAEPPGDLPFMTKWRVSLGAKTKEGLASIEEDLGVKLNVH